MLSQGAQAAQELPAGRDQAYGEVEKGKGRKPLSNRASIYFNRTRSEQRSEKANKNPSFPPPSLSPTLTQSAKGAGSLEGIYSDAEKSL